MKSSRTYVVDALALGWLVLVAWCVLLFWLRCTTWQAFVSGVSVRETAQPSGLVPDQIEKDPNVTIPSSILARCRCDRRDALGLISDLAHVMDTRWPIARVEFDGKAETLNLTYWDEQSGLFVSGLFKGGSGARRGSMQACLYAGPEGVSDRPGRELGRFVRPVCVRPSWIRFWTGIVYDGGPRQFYRIDLGGRRVVKGPEIAVGLCPIQIGFPEKRENLISLDWTPPLRSAREGEKAEYTGDRVRVGPRMGRYVANKTMVLDEDSRIYLLDVETLTLAGPIGELPAVGPRSSNRPQDLLAYSVQPLYIEGQYVGCIVAAVAADATDMEAIAYDKEGRRVAWGEHYSKTGFRDSPGSSGALASQYLLECLHPLSLSLLSRVLSPRIEAMAGHRGLFVLPNSFVAIRARESESYALDRLLVVVAILLPALCLAAWLAWKVVQDGGAIGLSGSTVRWWIVAVVAFGVPAYIAYRLMRPEITLVTCPNCGSPRRPDMERCHRCGAPWQVPELAPPSWRVRD